MSDFAPILCEWDGEAFRPANRVWARRADAELVVGERYQVEPRQERSAASHRHYFAAVHEAWVNLPEHLAERFPTSEHLRKYALIRTGWRDEEVVSWSTEADARRFAQYNRARQSYAVILVSENVTTVLTAKSQSYRAMGKQDFQKSKDDVLGLLAHLIDVTPEELQRNAARAA